jgi:hypothetical protein
MYPDAHIYIYRAEQAANERAHLRYADRPARSRTTLSDLIRSLTGRHRPATGMRNRRLAWRAQD